ncbi:MAG: hypothetical protein ACR65T_02270 [Methylocystis sp.]|uniref:hypothetical protein n=1 Tax=Methylocystis sp. TaxID=1911079 RepID=UPI003DA257D6
MEELTSNVVSETKLDPTVAKAALGLVLGFLRDEDTTGNMQIMIAKMPRAQQDIEAAQSVGDGGVTQVIEGMTSFIGHGRADVNILAGQLEKLGISEAQTDALVREVLKRAENILGAEGAEKIRNILPALRERTDSPTDLRKRA